jgi:hypothetical protein
MTSAVSSFGRMALAAGLAALLAGCFGAPASMSLTGGEGSNNPLLIAGAVPGVARVEPLSRADDSNAPFCTADGVWCAALNETDDFVVSRAGGKDVLLQAEALGFSSAEGADRGSLGVAPHIIRAEGDGDAWLLLTESVVTAYAGGGGGATTTIIASATTGAPVWKGVTGASKLIRACFSEAEYNSGVACHDDVHWGITLTLAPPTGTGAFDLVMKTVANVHPGRRKGRDAKEYPRGCNYTRTLRLVDGTFTPTRPEPECSSYSTV